MRIRLSAIIVSFFLLTLALAACGESSGGGSGSGNELDMGAASFTQTSITLSTGQALHMVDSQDFGGAHMICIGQNGKCDSGASGPSELADPGMAFNPGTTKDVTFSTAGTYHLTCTLHPNMNVTVTVQ
ncbi:MAG TPA: plastocyanin/azurin family copper-binding protein [Ktedonobacterales bacterium]|nr:plastocyanin/azurin family copper-binding protein [Ktedonobacterales bacterium]